MDQYLLIPFLGEWTSIYQLFWCSPGVQGFDTLPFIIKIVKFNIKVWVCELCDKIRDETTSRHAITHYQCNQWWSQVRLIQCGDSMGATPKSLEIKGQTPETPWIRGFGWFFGGVHVLTSFDILWHALTLGHFFFRFLFCSEIELLHWSKLAQGRPREQCEVNISTRRFYFYSPQI